MQEIENRLNKISNIFEINKLIDQKPTLATVQKYYSKNKLAYTIFHSKENFIHLGISNNDNFKKDDLIEPVKFINKYIKNSRNYSVLELATGRGANSNYLALNNKKTRFYGIDMSPGQLEYAYKVERRLKNYTVLKQDFHNLSNFKNNSLDVIFVIESLCYSNNKQKILNETNRILKNNGKLIVIDGYLENQLNAYTKVQQQAFKLTEIGMAIKGSNTYKEFLQFAKNSNYKIEYEENISNKVLPSMRRLEKYSKLFFKFKYLAKILKVLLPTEIILNAITAYLWVPLTEQKVVGYYITVLKKI